MANRGWYYVQSAKPVDALNFAAKAFQNNIDSSFVNVKNLVNVKKMLA